MAIDYSKVNNALSGFVGSGERSRREQSELAGLMQLAQTQQQLQAQRDKDELEMETHLDNIKAKANQVAMRNEDVDFVQSLYDEQKNIFLSELEKHGNDPVRFMNSGGRRVLRDFSKNVLHGDEATRIRSNTAQIQSYYDAEERDGGKNAKYISKTSRQQLVDFMEGRRDTFEFKQLAAYKENLTEADYQGYNSKSEALLNKENNRFSVISNYKNEYNMPTNYEPSEDELVMYLDGYYGQQPKGRTQEYTSTTTQQVPSSLAGDMRNQYDAVTGFTVNTSKIGKEDAEYARSLSDFQLANINFNVSPENTDVMGHRAFQGRESEFAKAFVDPTLTDDNSTVSGYTVNNSDGQWYTEDGGTVLSGESMPDLEFGGVFLAYRIKERDDNGSLTSRLVKAEDLEEKPRDAEHVLIQEFEDDGLFSSDYYYKELKMRGQSGKLAQLSKSIGLDSAYKNVEKTSPQERVEYDSSFKITANTTAEKLTPHLASISQPTNMAMSKMGLEPDNIKIRSTILAIAMADGEDTLNNINLMNQRFNREQTPEIYEALASGDTNNFFNTLMKDFINKGYDEKEVRNYLSEVDKFRTKILQAHNI